MSDQVARTEVEGQTDVGDGLHSDVNKPRGDVEGEEGRIVGSNSDHVVEATRLGLVRE